MSAKENPGAAETATGAKVIPNAVAQDNIGAAETQDWLLAEWYRAVDAVKSRHFEALIRVGIPADFLWRGPMKFGVTRITTDGEAYEPTNDGRPACIVPAIPLPSLISDPDGALAWQPGDLIAFHLTDPGTWWRRIGDYPLLNPDVTARAATKGEPLAISPSPLSWMLAGGIGIVVIDPFVVTTRRAA